MKKNFIVENIEKYFLGGLVGGVVWNLDGSKVNINFSTETKDAVGELSFDLSLPEGKIGIYNTDSLLRLLGITNEDLQLELKSDNTGIVNKLKISDNLILRHLHSQEPFHRFSPWSPDFSYNSPQYPLRYSTSPLLRREIYF